MNTTGRPITLSQVPSSSPPRQMIYRRLGRTGLHVSLLSLGSWVTFDWQLDTAAAKTIIGAAYDAGINFFDTAEAYAYGKSEEILGRAVRELGLPRENIVISTKLYHGASKNPPPTARGLSRKHIIEGCKASLARLQLDHVDIIYAHRPDPTVSMEEIVRAFNWLIDQGWAFYWGTSEWPVHLIEEACHVADRLNLVPPTVEQPQYSILHRRRVEIDLKSLVDCRGLGLTTFSPLACGLLTGKYGMNSPSPIITPQDTIAGESGGGALEEQSRGALKVVDGRTLPQEGRFTVERYRFLADRWLTPDKLAAADGIRPIAESLGATSAQLALAFCAANPAVSTVITGATKLEQLRDNLNALALVDSITPDVIAKIEAAVGGGKELDMGTQSR